METDKELLRSAIDGDPDAFSRLVVRYECFVLRVCRDYLRDEHDVRDAAQDTFVRAYRRLADVRDADRFGGWLRRIARSVCLNRIQGASRAQLPLGGGDDYPYPAGLEVADPQPGPQDLLQQRELADAVTRCVRQLPPEYREPVELFYLQERPHKDVATVLGLTPATVRVRLHRARSMLRPGLAEFSRIDVLSRSKRQRHWLPSNLINKEKRDMTLAHTKHIAPLLRGDGHVTIRAMTRDDIPAVRRYDIESTAALGAANAQVPPGGTMGCSGGPWAEDDTLAAHFEAYRRRGFITLLAEDDEGRLVGFADLWIADEPEPFGRSLNVECIDYFREYYLAGLETVLLAEAEEVACAAGIPALDIGTNTCSGDYPSLRRFGLKIVYEYDDILCRCPAERRGPAPEVRELGVEDMDLTGLLKLNHWSPTDFAWRDEGEQTVVLELAWEDERAVVEFWRYEHGRETRVPPEAPDRADVFVVPATLTSPARMTRLLAECAYQADRLGAETVRLPCPGDITPDSARVEMLDREFGVAWLRKHLA